MMPSTLSSREPKEGRHFCRPASPAARRTMWPTGMSALLTLLPAFISAAPVEYHTDIAPLLRDYCAGCHNAGDYEGGLSVETFAALMEGGETEGKTILTPGKPDESYLLQTVLKTAKPAMPPKKEPQPTADEIALLKRWIEEGAKGPAKEHDVSLLSTLNVPEIAPTPAAKDAITAAAFSRDGSLESFARHGRIELHGTDGKNVRTLETPEGKINALHFSADGTKLVAATGISGLKGEAIVFDTKRGAVIKTIGEGTHRDILFDAEFSPDGAILATAGYDRNIHLWDLATGKLLRSMTSHNGAVYDLAFSPDGTVLASASGDGTCKIWLVATGERLDTLNQPEAEQYRVAFTPEGKHIVAAGADNRIRLWRFVSKTAPKLNPLLQTKFGHEDDIVDLAVSPDGKQLVTTSSDRSLKLWSLPALETIKDFGPQSDLLAVLAFAGKGEILFASRLDGSQERLPLAGLAPPAHAAAENDAVTVKATDVEVETLKLTEAASGSNPMLVRRSETRGKIGAMGETDDYPFTAKAGETWVFEVNAQRSKSKLDSKLAVLDAKGAPVEQVVLQAVRDSWLTFRGKDSMTSGDFRVHNWEEMELDELLYVNGEVVKLHLYPRGPDSGFNVYPGDGQRHAFFGTSPITHALGEPAWIVQPLPPGSRPAPNGLPVFPLFYENDDDPLRRFGSDSCLLFTPPADGDYVVRVTDVRGFGGSAAEQDYGYELVVRPAAAGFEPRIVTKNPSVGPGGCREIEFRTDRVDGFDGSIRLEIDGLPAGFTFHGPIEIEAGQFRARGVLAAAMNAVAPDEAASKAVKVRAVATIDGREVVKDLGGLGDIKLGAAPKFTATIVPAPGSSVVEREGQPLEFTIRPGETITAKVLVDRKDFKDRIEFGRDGDADRNLPHGVFVDNIGLSGLLIVEGTSEREFFLTAAPKTRPGRRLFHLNTAADGGQASPPVILNVLPAGPAVAATGTADR